MPPAARSSDEHGNAKATVGYRLNLGQGGDYIAELFEMKLSNGSTLKLYCVQITVGLRTDVDMVERPWSKYPARTPVREEQQPKINWVLHNGYPGTGLDAIGNALKKPVSRSTTASPSARPSPRRRPPCGTSATA